MKLAAKSGGGGKDFFHFGASLIACVISSASLRKSLGSYEPSDVEKCEISGVTGTITTDAQGKPNVHLHLVLTRQDGSTVSGHLISATVDPILEVFVTDLGPGKDITVP